MVKIKDSFIRVKTAEKRPPFNLPFWEAESGREGPSLLITAAQHGNEVQGSEVIRRFCILAGEKLVKGKILMFPCINLPAVWNRRPHIISSPCMPYAVPAGNNLNSTWPGEKNGNETERLSYHVYEEVGKTCTNCIDIHCWERYKAAAALPRKDCPESMKLARISGMRFIQPVLFKPEEKKRPVIPCPLTAIFNDTGRPSLTIELSGQYTFVEKEIKTGVRVLSNSAKFLGLFKGIPAKLGKPQICLDEKTEVKHVRPPVSGLFVKTRLDPGDFVEKGTLLGHVLSDRDLSTAEIRAPFEGYLHRYGSNHDNCDVDLAGMHPYVKEDTAIASIAVC